MSVQFVKNISISSYSVLSNSSNLSKYKYRSCLHRVKCQTFLCQTIQFSVNTVLMSKTVLFQIIQLSISTQFKCKYGLIVEKISISSNSL